MDIKGFKSRDGGKHQYDYEALANIPESGTVTDEQIAAAVEKYLKENPVEGVTDQQVYDAVTAYLAENPVDGITPHIGENGNWYLGDTDTGVTAAGKDGEDGVSPHIGTNGNWYIGATDTGVKAAGKDGVDGTTPAKGKDYWTDSDKTEMVNAVLAALPTWTGGSY